MTTIIIQIIDWGTNWYPDDRLGVMSLTHHIAEVDNIKLHCVMHKTTHAKTPRLHIKI